MRRSDARHDWIYALRHREVYPALWNQSFAREDRTGDEHDAYSIAAWLVRADRDGSLAAFLTIQT